MADRAAKPKAGAKAKQPAARIRSWPRRVQDRIEIGALRALGAVMTRLPPRRASDMLAAGGGFLLPRLGFLRKRIERNLDLVRPDMPADERRRLAAGVGRHFSRAMLEYGTLDRIAADPSRLRHEGADPLAEAQAAGRGAILVSAHFGQWEAVRLAARAATGRDCAMVYRPYTNPHFDKWINSLLHHAGGPVIPKGMHGTRDLLRHLGRGGMVMILVDQRQTGAPLLPFLGREAETATVAAELALRYGAALIPARARRAEDGLTFDVRFEDEIPPSDPETMMAQVNDRIGAWVEADPDQWLWLHGRWKRRARGEQVRAARAEAEKAAAGKATAGKAGPQGG